MGKNWDAIQTIKDPHFKMAISLLKEDSDLGRRVKKGLPEYFHNGSDTGRIPWSILLKAGVEAVAQGTDETADVRDLMENKVHERFNIPLVTFQGPEKDYGYPVLPQELMHLLKLEGEGIGHTVEWNGAPMIVFENSMPDWIDLTPAGRIALDE